MQKYEWTVKKEMYINFDEIYEDAQLCHYDDEEAIHNNLAYKDDDVYYCITPDVRQQILKDYRKWKEENNKN